MSGHTLDELCSTLNAQTGKMAWPELERHFARGIVIKLSAGIDLIKAAAAVVMDDTESVSHWMKSSDLVHASVQDAVDWTSRQPEFRAVVAAPWVIIQEIE